MASNFSNSAALLEGKLATLRTLQPMLDAIPAFSADVDPSVKTAFDTIKNVVSILIAQNIEEKSESVLSRVELKQSAVRSCKTEQYSRRNTTVLVGLPVDSSESTTSSGKLAENVAKKLTTVSGVTVKQSDFSAVHRNSSSGDTPRTRQAAKSKNPSVTVCFYNSNLKDSVLMKYKNFDLTQKKPRDVRLYQSLSKFYTDLKANISSDLEDKLGKGKVKWIHWRSQTTGFVVRLKDSNNSTLRNIFCFEDYERELSNSL